jgi:hypothetical protein
VVNLVLLAEFVEELDCSSEFEDDCFSFWFENERIYCERLPTAFFLHVGNERHSLPR